MAYLPSRKKLLHSFRATLGQMFGLIHDARRPFMGLSKTRWDWQRKRIVDYFIMRPRRKPYFADRHDQRFHFGSRQTGALQSVNRSIGRIRTIVSNKNLH